MRVLTAAGINAVSLANNHARDFGQDGLLDAIARLQANNISVVGASEKTVDSPLIFQTRAGAKGASESWRAGRSITARTRLPAAIRIASSRSIPITAGRSSIR